MYPLKIISKLECRFEKFSDLDSNCKQDLPILKPKDYERYAKMDEGFNDFTRVYTVLWWWSYTYGWDVGNGWHIGVDIATAEGTPVYAIYDGTVIIAKNMISWGNNVSIEHTINRKTVVSNYSHLSKIDVKSWDKISAGDKIGEVGSTWNSFWNHLHFQIDLKSKFHPYYYDYSECPYSYNEITEKWVCFDVLEKHTLDPLEFMSSGWAILNNIKTQTTSVSAVSNTIVHTHEEDSHEEDLHSAFDESIFDRTVYSGYNVADIKTVQKIYKDLGVYKGDITGDYNDVVESVIRYQLDKNIIASRSETWVGYFGPKTRAQTKIDYLDYLKSDVPLSDNQEVIVSRFDTQKKIEKTWLLSRKDIEKKETDNFLKSYTIDFRFDEPGYSIVAGEKKIIHLTITDKYKGKPFKWNLPLSMTFEYDEAVLGAFPSKLFSFTDGKRDIAVTWVASWDSSFKIMLWTTELKKYDFKVLKDTQAKVIPTSVRVVMSTKSVVWEIKTWLMIFKDSNWKNIVWAKFWGGYKLVSRDEVLFCIKKWSLKDIKKIYSKPCKDSDFSKEITLNYEDTVGWILIFDYKVASSNAQVNLTWAATGRTLWTKKVATISPKWLTEKYDYYDDVMAMLRKWIVTWINKWYFLQDRELTETDALEWISQALISLKETTTDIKKLALINDRLNRIQKEDVSKFNSITRKWFLDKVYEYLVFEDAPYVSITYKDLTNSENKKINAIFDENTTWKEQFWETHFRPEWKMTRWEWAFLLSKIMDKAEEIFLTVNK